MEIPYGSYEYVVLDACIFTQDFPEDLRGYLASHRVLVADTFDSELEGYEDIVPAHQRECFENNKRLARSAVQPADMFSPERYVRHGLNRDITGLIRLLACSSNASPLSHHCLVITSDLTLLEQIVLESIPVDVYYLTANEYFTAADREKLLGQFDYPQMDETELPGFEHANDAVAYTATGAQIRLKRLHQTRTACIYAATGSRYAKVFKNNRLSKAKIDHVSELIKLRRALRLDWVLFPRELLYADPEGTQPVGFLMPQAGNTTDITRSLRLQLEPDRWEHYINVPYGEYLHLAWMIVRQVMYLKVYNVCPSDFNPHNFALMIPDGMAQGRKPRQCRKLYMWDTDSFCLKGYASNRWHDGLQPPSKWYHSMAKCCANALYQYIFYLLTLGLYPYDPERGDGPVEFRFPMYSPDMRGQFFYIPANLRRLFHQVFVCGYEPSIPCLLHELEEACSTPVNDKMLGTLDAEAEQLGLRSPEFYTTVQTPAAQYPAYPSLPEISVPLSFLNGYTESFVARRNRRTAPFAAQAPSSEE